MEIDKIRNKLKEVIDPEIGYDIVSLGEIENIEIKENIVKITLLPTTPLCPYLPFIINGIKEKMIEIGIREEDLEIEIDFENKWDIDRIDPEIRKRLGI